MSTSTEDEGDSELSRAHHQIRVLESKLREARSTAHVLAHAYDHDTRPPDDMLDRARRWMVGAK